MDNGLKLCGLKLCKQHCPSPKKIQAVFRGFLCRKKLNVFKKLPPEIWDIVLFHTKFENNVIHKYLQCVIKINIKKEILYKNKVFNSAKTILFGLLSDEDKTGTSEFLESERKYRNIQRQLDEDIELFFNWFKKNKVYNYEKFYLNF